MNDLRHPLRAPVATGPSVLAVLVALIAGAHVLRTLFSVPTEVPPGALSMASLLRGEWWSVFTWMFTHRDVLHLVMNLTLLVLGGRAVERQVGGRHMLYMFILSAWTGAALHLMFEPDSLPIIGASGGVFGIIGAFSALFPEYDLMRPLRGIVPGRLKAKRLFPAFLVAHITLELMRRFLPGDAVGGIVSDTAHLVHAGGLAAGWLYGRYRAADDTLSSESWNDFFPQGLRRRSRESNTALPVAAGLPPRRLQQDEEVPEFSIPPRELSDSDFLREQVDPVLEKLYEHGADKLSPEEKAVLEEAARRFSKGRP
jgi:membrane associated rhomboid family serine protease